VRLPLPTWLAAWLTTLVATPLHADQVTIAVAANFLAPLEALQPAFAAASGHELVLVAGSTGQLYAQIINGAPFDVLLSADQEHALRLVTDGLGEDASRFTYAVGKLALWTRDRSRFAPLGLGTLRHTDFRWLAIANPELAPYGLAAEQTLRALDLWTALQPRVVRGQSIAQTFAMAATGNADLAFVALSQAISYQGTAEYFEVPTELHEPLRQDAVLLRRAANDVAALAFMAFLQGPHARAIIERFGYDVGTP